MRLAWIFCRVAQISWYMQSCNIQPSQIMGVRQFWMYNWKLMSFFLSSPVVDMALCTGRRNHSHHINISIEFWPLRTPLLYSKTGVFKGIHYFCISWISGVFELSFVLHIIYLVFRLHLKYKYSYRKMFEKIIYFTSLIKWECKCTEAILHRMAFIWRLEIYCNRILSDR